MKPGEGRVSCSFQPLLQPPGVLLPPAPILTIKVSGSHNPGGNCGEEVGTADTESVKKLNVLCSTADYPDSPPSSVIHKKAGLRPASTICPRPHLPGRAAKPLKQKTPANGGFSGGPGGIRTLDLFSAIEARSQLRYRPLPVKRRNCIRKRGGCQDASHLTVRGQAYLPPSRRWPVI